MTQTASNRAHRTPPGPLALRRLSVGLRQADLARDAGVGRETLSRLERGINTPQLRTAQKLADALGVGVEIIFPARPHNDVERPGSRPHAPTAEGTHDARLHEA